MDVVLNLLVSLLLFLFVSAGGYFVWLKIAPFFQQYRSGVIQETLTSLDEQFLFLTPRQANLIHILSTAGLMILGGILLSGLEWPWSVVGVFFFGYAGYKIPRMFIQYFSKRRLEKIERQIPDFLKMMAGSLRAGLSLSEAMKQAVKEIPPPFSQELGLVLKKIKMGESFEESFKYLDHRLKLEEMSLVVSAIILSNEAGGSLTPVFDRLENTLVERKRIKGKIDALTAQGRMQGWVVGALPFFLGVILFLIDPGLITPLWTTVAGGAGLVAILLLEVAGFWLIRKIVEGGEV